MNSKPSLTIMISRTSDTIEMQLLRQHLAIRSDDILKRVQQDADAILRLSMCGLLTESESSAIRKRLNALIAENVIPLSFKKVGV